MRNKQTPNFHIDIDPSLYRHWRYKNTTLLLVSLVLLYYVADSEPVTRLIHGVGTLGYLGAFFTGMFFVSVFTVAPAGLVLFRLAETFHPLEIALFAGAGGVLGDFIIFRLLKDRIFDELKPVFFKVGRTQIGHLFHTPYFAWVIPIIGASIIASPLPDELGIGLLGASQVKWWQFMLLTFVLDFWGIFIIVWLAQIVR